MTRRRRWLARLAGAGLALALCVAAAAWYFAWHIEVYRLHEAGALPDEPVPEIALHAKLLSIEWKRRSLPGYEVELPANWVASDIPDGQRASVESAKLGVFHDSTDPKKSGVIFFPPSDTTPLLAAFDPTREGYWPTLFDLRRDAIRCSYREFRWDMPRTECRKLHALAVYRVFAGYQSATGVRIGESEGNRWLVIAGNRGLRAEVHSRTRGVVAEMLLDHHGPEAEAAALLDEMCRRVRFRPGSP